MSPVRVERLRFEVSDVRAEGERQLVSRWSARGGEVQGTPTLGSYAGRMRSQQSTGRDGLEAGGARGVG